MIKNYLLPNTFKKIGLWMILPFMAGCFYCLFGDGTNVWPCKVFAIYSDTLGSESPHWFTMTQTDGLLDEICMVGLAISFMFIAFSKEKIEDECISQIRMQSLVWALMVSTCLLASGVIFLYDFAFMYFSFAYPFFIFVLFISKFHYQIRKFKNEK